LPGTMVDTPPSPRGVPSFRIVVARLWCRRNDAETNQAGALALLQTTPEEFTDPRTETLVNAPDGSRH
jgi:hypothetical protein